jgi:carbon-monoxide dehydrogenase medium subunit
MKPPPFAYVRPSTLAEAAGALADAGDEAKVLAGGQSLVPMLNFRLARPSVLVDVTRVHELQQIERDADALVIGAAVRQHAAGRAQPVRERSALIAAAIDEIGHLQIRARGTVGGSIAHADPASELCAAAIALDAELQVASVRGPRTVAAAEFFLGPYMPALEPDELLMAVRIPCVEGLRTSICEVARRSGDFALAGAAVAVALDEREAVRHARIVGFGIGSTPQAIAPVERLVHGERLSLALCREAGEVAAGAVEPLDAPNAGAAHRRTLFGVMVERALKEVAGL